ncbi:hypothetical protein [Anatilimnocola floriformis]|uniref:hypothetical protein n=1 Tax=Anatilimnocola floriformis TaxID=2948575 RepID=UPI0020C5788D|nr:hypothetical protein [Anatilimnocola floriformis]
MTCCEKVVNRYRKTASVLHASVCRAMSCCEISRQRARAQSVVKILTSFCTTLMVATSCGQTKTATTVVKLSTDAGVGQANGQPLVSQQNLSMVPEHFALPLRISRETQFLVTALLLSRIAGDKTDHVLPVESPIPENTFRSNARAEDSVSLQPMQALSIRNCVVRVDNFAASTALSQHLTASSQQK